MGCNSFNFNGCFAVPVGYDFNDFFFENNEEDYTGFTFSMSIQAKNTAVDLLTLSVVGDDSTTGIYIPDPTSGIIFIQIMKADTLASGDYEYSIRITDTSSIETLFAYGSISFIEPI